MAKGYHYFKSIPPILLSFYILSSSTTTSTVDDIRQEVSHSKFGTFNFTELEQTMYDVEILKVPLPESALVKADSHQESGADHMVLVSKHGQRYACELPQQPLKDEPSEEEKQPNMNVTALLLPLKNRPCPIKTVGWWTYEYCHGQFVRQYHMEGGRLTGKTIYLGFYQNETLWDQEQIDRVQSIVDSIKDTTGGPLPVTYHQVSYVNGSVCDHTKSHRTARVLIRCSLGSDDKLYEVIEREVCNYTLVVHTALLCKHPLFVVRDKGRRRTLTCSPLLSQTDYQKYQDDKESKKKLTEDKKISEIFSHKAEPEPTTIESLLSKLFSQNTDQGEASHSDVTKQELLSSQRYPVQNSNKEDTEVREDKIRTSTAEAELPERPTLSKGANLAEGRTSSKKEATLFKGPASSQEKDDQLKQITEDIENAYKQLLASLAEQEDSDPTASKLKDSITSRYTEFDQLRKRAAMEEEVMKHLTDDEKNFRESKGSAKRSAPPKKDGDRLVVEPYEVQGVKEARGQSDSSIDKGGGEELMKEQTFTVERMTDIEEVINKEIEEHLRDNGIEGKADVKVVTVPLNVMEMLMDEDTEVESDDDDETVKVFLKFGEAQQLLSGSSQSSLSRMLNSFLNSPAPLEQSRMNKEQQRVADLEQSYDQVWGVKEDGDDDE